jgi:hypothetical protein
MIKVLGYRTYQETCNTCDAILSYGKSDVKTEGCVHGLSPDKYIQCPNCHEKVYVSTKVHE